MFIDIRSNLPYFIISISNMVKVCRAPAHRIYKDYVTICVQCTVLSMYILHNPYELFEDGPHSIFLPPL